VSSDHIVLFLLEFISVYCLAVRGVREKEREEEAGLIYRVISKKLNNDEFPPVEGVCVCERARTLRSVYVVVCSPCTIPVEQQNSTYTTFKIKLVFGNFN